MPGLAASWAAWWTSCRHRTCTPWCASNARSLTVLNVTAARCCCGTSSGRWRGRLGRRASSCAAIRERQWGQVSKQVSGPRSLEAAGRRARVTAIVSRHADACTWHHSTIAPSLEVVGKACRSAAPCPCLFGGGKRPKHRDSIFARRPASEVGDLRAAAVQQSFPDASGCVEELGGPPGVRCEGGPHDAARGPEAIQPEATQQLATRRRFPALHVGIRG